jgi:hypothetical protein
VEPLPEKDHGVPVKGPFAFDHVSLEVESDEDLWELKDLLEAAGAWVSEIVDHGFIHSLYAFDPNNIPIEFSAPTREVDLRSTPKMKDRSPSPAAREGSEPQPAHRPRGIHRTAMSERAVYPGEGRELVDPPSPNRLMRGGRE